MGRTSCQSVERRIGSYKRRVCRYRVYHKHRRVRFFLSLIILLSMIIWPWRDTHIGSNTCDSRQNSHRTHKIVSWHSRQCSLEFTIPNFSLWLPLRIRSMQDLLHLMPLNLHDEAILTLAGLTDRIFRHHDHKFEWTREEFTTWEKEWGNSTQQTSTGRALHQDPWGRD